MNLQSIAIKNFRRLKNVHIDLDADTSIFVGANNSGKTSATHALQLFLGSKEKFSLYDFNADCWKKFDDEGENAVQMNVDHVIDLPSIHLDLWFKVDASDLYRVIDLLPNLDWRDVPVGIRLEFAAKSPQELLANFKEVKNKAMAKQNGDDFHPWPKSLTDYLSKQLSEFEIRYYILDYAGFDDGFVQKENYFPRQINDTKERKASSVIRSLIRVDFLNAQRHLSDNSSPGRTEDLTKRMNRFYDRNLQKHEDNFDALKALTNSEMELDKHLATVFESTLKSLNKLGYPGVNDLNLVIKSAFNTEQMLSQNTRVHYSLEDPTAPSQHMTLPDKYNGLGFKNLIYMVIEILDFHARWIDSDARSPLHLIVIEEPEAHLHTQIQQVFIREIRKILDESDQAAPVFHTQLIVTTHSPHIIYECGFLPIRYFRRTKEKGIKQTSEVLNLSKLYDSLEKKTRNFLQRYMKLAHCDLFFADAAVLVEGNVERLLLPLMIEKIAAPLNTSYLSLLEVGGAFAYRFQQLIEFLGIVTLVITDIDSVENDDYHSGRCSVEDQNAKTSNETLKQWLPKLTKISDLLKASEDEKIQLPTEKSPALVKVTYQSPVEISWEGETKTVCGRTLEETFALENLEWCQDKTRKHLGLRVVTTSRELSLDDLHTNLIKKIASKGFKKTDFALALMMESPDSWTVPKYIAEGLQWLHKELAPTQSTSEIAGS